MRITEIAIRNIKGIRDMKVSCGPVVEVSGRNGTGKTSMLQAVEAGLGAHGSLENLKSVGAEEEDQPSVTLVLGDGQYIIERKGAKPPVVKERIGNTEAYEKVKRPQEFIDSLHDAGAANPWTFVRAEPKARASAFLAALPLEMKAEQVRTALGDELYATVQAVVLRGGSPLSILREVYDAIYETRRGVNVSCRQMTDAFEKLKTQIPAHMDEATESGITDLEAQRDTLSAKVSKASADAEAAHRTAVAQLDSGFKAFDASRRGQLEREIANLRANAEADVTLEREKMLGDKRLLDDTRLDAIGVVSVRQKELDIITERLAQARASSDQIVRLRTLKDQAQQFEDEAEALKGKGARLTAGLDAIQALKMSLLHQAPIDGLTVDGNDIRIKGVSLDQLNKQQLLDLATYVAILRAKKKPLPIVILDDAEAFDEEHKRGIIARLEQAGVQAFVSYVSQDELDVR